MHWLEAVKKSKIGRAVRSYDNNKDLVRFADGHCTFRYKDTGTWGSGFGDSYSIEGYEDWEPDKPRRARKEK